MPTAPYLAPREGDYELDEAVFGQPFDRTAEALIHETTRAELNARRQGTSSTKTRGEVSMSGAKAFRQKGTGRARAGDLATPQRTGGGVAFGPTPRHFRLKVNRKARRRALRSALSVHAARGSLGVLDPADFTAPSTKQARAALDGFAHARALVVVAPDGEEAAALSFRNLDRVHVLTADAVGVADVIGARHMVASPRALEYLERLAVPPAPRPSGNGAEAPAAVAAGPRAEAPAIDDAPDATPYDTTEGQP